MTRQASRGSVGRRGLAWLLLLATLAAGLWLWRQQPAQGPVAPLAIPPPPTAESEPATPAPPAPHPQAPLTARPLSPASPPLPPLDDSDHRLTEDLTRLFGDPAIEHLLRPAQLLRKAVIILDNLPGRRLPVKYLPLKPPGGSFRVREEGGRVFLDAANYARYRPYIQLLERLDAADFVAFVRRYRPLLQAAYAELGYPDAAFEDRLLTVIDELLRTPEPAAPIELIQPVVYYKYADPALESLSAGQKLLLRMGPDNARLVKGKLRRVRELLLASGRS